MSNDEFRMRLYRINVSTKQIRKLMKNALTAADQGQLDEAENMFADVEDQLQAVRRETENLQAYEMDQHGLKQQTETVEFTELVRDSLVQAARYKDCSCSPIRFHIYS